MSENTKKKCHKLFLHEHEMSTPYNSKHDRSTHSKEIKAQNLQHKAHNSGNKLLTKTKNKIQT